MRKIFGFSFPLQRYFKSCVICVLIFFVIESLVFNTVVLYIIWQFYTAVSGIINSPGLTIFDKLAVSPFFASLVYTGKEGGFATILENTLGRIYIESIKQGDENEPAGQNVKAASSSIARIGIDVSSAGETLYILERIGHLDKNTKWEQFVVDIGANDGLLSSNSYNFIRWGWSAILVEPQSYQLDLAKRNLQGYISQHKDQQVNFVNAAISDYDGTAKFHLSSDIVAMESQVVSGDVEQGVVVFVPCYSVKTFAAKYIVPKRFGILSIDAEGLGSMILHQWMKLGYRPMYIIHESLHDPEDILDTKRKLKQAGYQYLIQRGWNHIFEYNSRADAG